MSLTFAQAIETAVQQVSDRKRLPLVHTTTFSALEKIVNTGGFRPRFDATTGGEHVFFFLGRPAYPVAEQLDTEVRPVAMLFSGWNDHADFQSPRTIYPFDSGGADRGFFGDWVKNQRSRFILRPGEDADRVRELFFRNPVRDYVTGTMNRRPEYHNTDCPEIIDEYARLTDVSYWETMRRQYDSRCCALEFTFANVTISSMTHLVVHWQDEDRATALLDGRGVHVHPYYAASLEPRQGDVVNDSLKESVMRLIIAGEING
jgi:hypothetical protein